MLPLLSKERMESYKKTATSLANVSKTVIQEELVFLQHLLEENEKLTTFLQIEFPEVEKRDTRKQYYAYELQRLKEEVEPYKNEVPMKWFIFSMDAIFSANEIYLSMMITLVEEITKIPLQSLEEPQHLMLLANRPSIFTSGLLYHTEDQHIVVKSENEKFYIGKIDGEEFPIFYSKRDVRSLTKGEQEAYTQSQTQEKKEVFTVKGIATKIDEFWYLKDEKNECMKDNCDDEYDAAGLLCELDSLSDFNCEEGDEIEIIVRRKK